MTDDLTFIASQILVEKFTGAEVVFLAGSIIRGEGTATSDLDLVVVYSGGIIS